MYHLRVSKLRENALLSGPFLSNFPVRELGFYRELADSRDDGDSALKGVIPAFYGTAVNEKGDEFLVLKDMTQGMARPTVIDVKIGRQTWLPDASEKKMLKERSKYLGTRYVQYSEKRPFSKQK